MEEQTCDVVALFHSQIAQCLNRAVAENDMNLYHLCSSLISLLDVIREPILSMSKQARGNAS